MKQFLVFVQKEMKHVFRDRKTLLLLFGMPIIQIILFGFALSNEVKNASIAILDYSKDYTTLQITEKLKANPAFTLYGMLRNYNEVEQTIKAGKVKMVVVFPAQFHKTLLQQGRGEVQFIADASDPNTAIALTNYATAILKQFQQGQQSELSAQIVIVPQVRMLYNPTMSGAANFVPGVMALVLLIVCVLMTAVSIVREKELGTMEILLVSPFNPLWVVISKAIPYLILSLINFGIIIILSQFLLGLHVAGSLIMLTFVTVIYIICALSLGLMISNITESQQTAMLIALMGMMLPTLILSGFMFPIENMPKPLQIISNIVPAKWYFNMVKAIMIKGEGISLVWKEMLILSTMTIFFLFISIKNFSQRLQ